MFIELYLDFYIVIWQIIT